MNRDGVLKESEGSVKGLMLSVLFVLILMCSPVVAATYYVDGSVATSGDGRSWATAWKGFSNITGLQPGDTVYVSGGSTSQAYSLSDWTPTGGSPGSPITYAVGQGAGHDGMVTITSGNFLNGTIHDVIIDGNVGGAQHWSVTVSGYVWEGGSGTNRNVILRYITVPSMGTGGAGFHWPSASNTAVEIHHCNITKANDSGNMHDFVFYAGNGTGVGALDVHDNDIKYPVSSSDHSIGDDMWIWPMGVSFHNNMIQGVPRATYSWSQHSDGFQTNSSSNILVYDNMAIDPGESFFYEDSQSAGTVSNILIYNNLIVRTIAPNGGAQRIFDMNPEGGGLGAVAYVDMVIANNTIIDQIGAGIFWCRVSGARSYTRVYVTNNIEYPSNTGSSFDAGVTVSNNALGNSVKFVSYTQYGGTSNNLRLANNDTAATGQGTSMATYFTTDIMDNTRTTPWDIGAYASIAGRPAPPTSLTAMPQ